MKWGSDSLIVPVRKRRDGAKERSGNCVPLHALVIQARHGDAAGPQALPLGASRFLLSAVIAVY